MQDYTSVAVPNQIAREIRTIAKSFDFYVQRNRRLVEHLYSKGYTLKDVGDILDITPQAVSLQYPKGDIK